MRALRKMRSPSVTKYLFSLFKTTTALLILIVAYQIQGQTITSFEYYFGSDPGFGNGTVISANANTGEITQDLVIPVTGFNEGFQKLSIRALDDGGTWSLFDATNFYIFDFTTGATPISNLDDAEYWFDADPGFGNGTPLTFTGNPSEVTESFAIPLGTLDAGFHILRIRTKNLDGDWSLYSRTNFYIFENTGPIPISDIAALEYWLGTDPGFGNGTPLTVTGNPSELTDTYIIPLTGLDEGFETISIRAQNLDGEWSLFDKKTFYISDIPGSDPISNLQRLEYWIDTDPGFGNGMEIAINGAPSDYSEPLIIPIGDLDGGFHELGIRAQNLEGTWSLYDKKQFFVFDNDDFITPPVAPITEIEYLYDAELGFGTGTPLAFTPTGNPDEYLIEIPTDLVTCDIHDIWISMKDTNGNYSLYQILENVDVFDNQDPTIVVFSDITVELNAAGQGSITISDVDNGTFDDCELVSVVLDQPQIDYTCADLGANTVTVTATDAEAKVSTMDVTINVVDNIDPVAVAQDITIALDAAGVASITADDLENGSTDNCSIVSRSVDITDFDCTNLGVNTVNFTVTDPNGNTNTVSATVTVEDNTNPIAITQNLTVQLDGTGTASIVPDDVDLSTDNCTIVAKSLDIDTFDCSDLGANTVTLTVTDQSGNSNSAATTITVEDSIDPTAVAQNITVQLDATGNVSILPAQVDDASSDNCTITTRSLDISSFACSDIGDNTVTLTVTDQSGNSDSATATVTVEDNINPTAIGQNITVQLDASGNATISATDIDNGSNDNCAIDTRSLDITNFDCDDIGDNTVTLTVTDSSGNSNDTTVTVTVEDNISPAVTTQDVTVQLDASGNVTIIEADVENSLNDSCGIASSVLNVTSFDCNDLGDNTITLTVTDVNGNVTNVNATITVEDNIDPVAVPTSTTITLELDTTGSGSLSDTSYDGGSTDNCSVVSDAIFPSDYTCADLGSNAATFEVTDSAGNMASAPVTIEVVDNIDPIASGQDITVDLLGLGSVSIVAADVDDGSSDNCGTTVLSIDVDTFTEEGVFPVVLTVTDGSGNTSTVTVNVTVTDSLSINDEEYSPKDIKLYPNPVFDKLYLDTELIITTVQVVDLTGKLVLEKANPGNSLFVKNLEDGAYFIIFNIDDKKLTKQFIKH